ncbi:MAG: hypothetical protein QM658_10520 [Gordonia sp. (in: high G+C Gram-positive bacteria)]
MPDAIAALRTSIELNLRLRAYPLRRAGAGRWICPGVRYDIVSPSVFAAAAHVRSPEHVFRRFPSVPTDLIFELVEGLRWRDHFEHPSWELLTAASPLVTERDGVEILWEAGISPDAIVRLHAMTGAPDNSPLTVADYLRLAYVDSKETP